MSLLRRKILKLLLWCYRDVVKDFTKLTSGEEFFLYKFGTPNDVVKLLKYLQTAQVLWYYEAKDDKERCVVKGASMILKTLIDCHKEVLEIVEREPFEDKQLDLWDRYRKSHKTT